MRKTMNPSSIKRAASAVLFALILFLFAGAAAADAGVRSAQTYEITSAGTGLVEVTVNGRVDAAVMAEIKTACGSNAISAIRINEGGSLIDAGSLSGIKVYNAGAISGDFTLYDVVNYATGVVSGSYEKEDGDFYFDSSIRGEIENYGSISYLGLGNATVKLNEGSIKVAVGYNVWEWDEGYGWTTKERLAEYGKSVSEAMGGGGWYTTAGAFANDLTIGLSNVTYYKQWTISDGVMTVKPIGSNNAKPVAITSDMLADVTKIVVEMGTISVDSISIPVVLKNTKCDDGVYWTSALAGGTYAGDITVESAAEIANCTINGNLTLKTHCAIEDTASFGSGAQITVTGSLGSLSNMWKPNGYPYTYNVDLIIAEGASVSVGSSFNGKVTNYGTLSSGFYYGDVLNYGSITGGTFYGTVRDYSAHEHAPGGSETSVSWTRWDGSSRLTLTSGDHYIALAGDVNYAYNIAVNQGAHLYLCLDGYDLTSTYWGDVITVASGGTLTLCDCSGSEGAITHKTGVSGRGVNVNGGVMHMYGGRVANNVSSVDGAGVRVDNGGSFTMHGGKITGNNDGTDDFIHGGGVMCEYKSTFIMNGGEISGNTARRGGGVRVSNGSAMYMHGGSISGNAVTDLGGGLYMTGTVTVEMTGGSITGNTAYEGGGVFNNSYIDAGAGFTMTGGSITGNTATAAAAGVDGWMYLSGSPVISGNKLEDGTASNLVNGNIYNKIIGDLSGNVYVSPLLPSQGYAYIFLERTDGALTASDIASFHADNASYRIYLDEDGNGVLGFPTYQITLTDAVFADGTSSKAVAPGTQLEIRAAVPEGRIFAGWTRQNSHHAIESTEPVFTFTMPPIVTSISADFVDEFEIVDGTLIAYHGNDPVVTVPDTVTAVAEGAFANASALETVVLPPLLQDKVNGIFAENVLRLFANEGRLLWVENIQPVVNLPESITAISTTAFSGSAIESLSGPAVTSLSGSAFSGCASLTSVSLPVLETVSSSAFSTTPALTSADLPMVRTVGFSAFSSSGIATLSLPAAVTIEEAAFSSSSITSISIPAAQTIGDNAFSNCQKLLSFSAPEVTSLGESAFRSDAKLTSVSIPRVKDIPAEAFLLCTSLSSLEHDTSTAHSIGSSAFMGSALTSFDLTNVVSVGPHAFASTLLTDVTVPDSVTAIGENAFPAGCIIRSSATAYARVWAQENGWTWEHDKHNAVLLPAVDATCTKTGLTEGSWCPDCETILLAQEEIPATGHTEVVSAEAFAPTCTTSGASEEISCFVCHAVLIPAEVLPATGHTDVIDQAVPPTCTEPGKTEGKHCSVCKEVLAAQEAIEALGHSEAIIEGFAPTCTEDGLMDYIFCEVCGEELQAADVIPATGHTDSITLEAAAPSCTEAGRTEEHRCSVCKALLAASESLPATGHTEYVSAQAVAPGCASTGLTAETSCSVCGEVLVPAETVPALGHAEVTDEAVAPTCTETGLTEGSHCEVCGETIKPQETVDALGHTPVIDPAAAPTDYETGLTEGSHCEVCGDILTPQEVIPANFTWDGTTITAYNGTSAHVVIPEGAAALGNTVFKNNTSILSVTVPDSVTSIGMQTFYGCTGLEDVYLPDELSSIGATAFYRVTARIHANAESAAAVALSYRSVSFTTEDGFILRYRVTSAAGVPSAVWFMGYCGSESAVILPGTVNGAPLTQIGERAFAGQTRLTDVILPDSVTVIGDYAFDGCTGMFYIELPDGITSVGASTFPYDLIPHCHAGTTTAQTLTAMGIGYGVLNDYTYSVNEDGTATITGYSGAETNIEIPAKIDGLTVTALGEYAFHMNTALTSVIIPEGVTALEQDAFNGCSSLNRVTLPDSLTFLGANAFNGCSALTGIDLPDGIVFIGEEAFRSCGSLISIDLPDGVTELYYNTFDGCTSLESITLPDSLIRIDSAVFQSCSSLQSVTLPEGVTSIGSHAFNRCVRLTDIELPAGVTVIGNSAFHECTALQSITLPERIASIGDLAFSNCPVLTATVKNGSYAHNWCLEHDIAVNVITPATEMTVVPLSRMNSYGASGVVGQNLSKDGAFHILVDDEATNWNEAVTLQDQMIYWNFGVSAPRNAVGYVSISGNGWTSDEEIINRLRLDAEYQYREDTESRNSLDVAEYIKSARLISLRDAGEPEDSDMPFIHAIMWFSADGTPIVIEKMTLRLEHSTSTVYTAAPYQLDTSLVTPNAENLAGVETEFINGVLTYTVSEESLTNENASICTLVTVPEGAAGYVFNDTIQPVEPSSTLYHSHFYRDYSDWNALFSGVRTEKIVLLWVDENGERMGGGQLQIKLVSSKEDQRKPWPAYADDERWQPVSADRLSITFVPDSTLFTASCQNSVVRFQPGSVSGTGDLRWAETRYTVKAPQGAVAVRENQSGGSNFWRTFADSDYFNGFIGESTLYPLSGDTFEVGNGIFEKLSSPHPKLELYQTHTSDPEWGGVHHLYWYSSLKAKEPMQVDWIAFQQPAAMLAYQAEACEAETELGADLLAPMFVDTQGTGCALTSLRWMESAEYAYEMYLTDINGETVSPGGQTFYLPYPDGHDVNSAWNYTIAINGSESVRGTATEYGVRFEAGTLGKVTMTWKEKVVLPEIPADRITLYELPGIAFSEKSIADGRVQLVISSAETDWNALVSCSGTQSLSQHVTVSVPEGAASYRSFSGTCETDDDLLAQLEAVPYTQPAGGSTGLGASIGCEIGWYDEAGGVFVPENADLVSAIQWLDENGEVLLTEKAVLRCSHESMDEQPAELTMLDPAVMLPNASMLDGVTSRALDGKLVYTVPAGWSGSSIRTDIPAPEGAAAYAMSDYVYKPEKHAVENGCAVNWLYTGPNARSEYESAIAWYAADGSFLGGGRIIIRWQTEGVLTMQRIPVSRIVPDDVPIGLDMSVSAVDGDLYAWIDDENTDWDKVITFNQPLHLYDPDTGDDWYANTAVNFGMRITAPEAAAQFKSVTGAGWETDEEILTALEESEYVHDLRTRGNGRWYEIAAIDEDATQITTNAVGCDEWHQTTPETYAILWLDAEGNELLAEKMTICFEHSSPDTVFAAAPVQVPASDILPNVTNESYVFSRVSDGHVTCTFTNPDPEFYIHVAAPAGAASYSVCRDFYDASAERLELIDGRYAGYGLDGWNNGETAVTTSDLLCWYDAGGQLIGGGWFTYTYAYAPEPEMTVTPIPLERIVLDEVPFGMVMENRSTDGSIHVVIDDEATDWNKVVTFNKPLHLYNPDTGEDWYENTAVNFGMRITAPEGAAYVSYDPGSWESDSDLIAAMEQQALEDADTTAPGWWNDIAVIEEDRITTIPLGGEDYDGPATYAVRWADENGRTMLIEKVDVHFEHSSPNTVYTAEKVLIPAQDILPNITQESYAASNVADGSLTCLFTSSWPDISTLIAAPDGTASYSMHKDFRDDHAERYNLVDGRYVGYQLVGWPEDRIQSTGSDLLCWYDADGQLIGGGWFTYTYICKEDELPMMKLPAALKVIHAESFAGASIQAVTVPDGGTSIGSRAFADCAALKEAHIPASVTDIAEDAFDGCTKLIIFAPAGSMAAGYAEAHDIPWFAE